MMGGWLRNHYRKYRTSKCFIEGVAYFPATPDDCSVAVHCMGVSKLEIIMHKCSNDDDSEIVSGRLDVVPHRASIFVRIVQDCHPRAPQRGCISQVAQQCLPVEPTLIR